MISFRPISALVALSLGTLSISLPAAAAPDASTSNGGTLFHQRCQMCHTVTPGQAPTIGPNLSGVVGRKAASTSYTGYTEALKASKLVWTRAKLDAFLSGPQQMVPGTRMVIRLADPAERAAVIDFLAHTGH